MSAKRSSVFMQSAGPASNSFESPRKTGFMTKHGGQGFKASWRRRYFVLDSGYLFYYASENEKKPLGIVCLADYCDCRRVSSDDPKNITKKHPNMIILKAAATSDPSAVTRDYYMFTDTEEEMSTWISSVNVEISTAQHDDSVISRSGHHRKDATDGNVLSKGKKITKDEQKCFDEVTKRAGESSALQHITASRPRPVGRRKPRKYQTYDEDDEAGVTVSCAPRLNQIEAEPPVSPAEKRTQSTPGKNRALLPKKGPPLVPPSGGAKAQQPAEASTVAPQSNGPPPLPSGKKPSAEANTDVPQSNGPPPLPNGKKPAAEASTDVPQSNGPPPLPSKKPSAEANTEVPQSNGPPPLPSGKKPSAEGSTEAPESSGPPPLPSKKPPTESNADAPESNESLPLPSNKKQATENSTETPTPSGPPPVPGGKPKRTTEPTEEPKSKVPVDAAGAKKDNDGSPPIPQKMKKQIADRGMESEDADGVVGPKKGLPPPLPTKEKPSKLQPMPPPEVQAKNTTKGSEQPSSTVDKDQPELQPPASEAVGGSSPKVAPKPATSAYKPKLSPAILSKRPSAEKRTPPSPTTKPKAELPLPKPRNRSSVGEDAASPPSQQQQQQSALAKPVPKPRVRLSSANKHEGEAPTPTSPVGKPEEGASTPMPPTTPKLVGVEDKPSAPTSPTTPLQVAKTESNKPPTPTSSTTPKVAAKVEDKPSVPAPATTSQQVAKTESNKPPTPTSSTTPKVAAKVEDKPSAPAPPTTPQQVAKAENDKPSAPAPATTQQQIAKAESNKPPTPTSSPTPKVAAKVEDKPSAPTPPTTPQQVAKAENDKPSVPTPPSAPQSAVKAEKDEPSTLTLAAVPDPVSPDTEAIEVTPSTQIDVKGPIVNTTESRAQDEVSQQSEQEGFQEKKNSESPQQQPPVDVVDAPSTVTTDSPPTSQETATTKELGEEGKDGTGAGSDDEKEEVMAYDVPRSWVVPDTTGLNQEQVAQPSVNHVPPTDASKPPTSQQNVPEEDASEQQYEPFELPSPSDTVSKSTTTQQNVPEEDASEQQYEPFELPSPSDTVSKSTTTQQNVPEEDASEQQYEPIEIPSPSDAASGSTTEQRSVSQKDSQDQYEPFEIAADQKQEHRASALAEICESAYGLVDESLENEATPRKEEKDKVVQEEGVSKMYEGVDDDSDNSDDDVYEAMTVPEEEVIERIGYVKMKSGASINALTEKVTMATPPRKARNEQGYDNLRLRSSPYTNRDVKSISMSLPRDRDMRQTRSGHSSTSTEYEMVPSSTKEEIEGFVNEFDFYPDTPSLNLEQAREVLRLARIARKEAEEMRRKARQELELAERERKDGELIKRNALEILRMAKEKLEQK